MKKEGEKIIDAINSCLTVILANPKYYDDLGINLWHIQKIGNDLMHLRNEIRRIDNKE